MINKALWTYDKVVSGQEKANEIDLETTLSIYKILSANLQALNYCSISLRNLLTDDAEYNSFMGHFSTGSIIKFAQGTEK